jgi:hypothetical protein
MSHSTSSALSTTRSRSRSSRYYSEPEQGSGAALPEANPFHCSLSRVTSKPWVETRGEVNARKGAGIRPCAPAQGPEDSASRDLYIRSDIEGPSSPWWEGPAGHLPTAAPSRGCIPSDAISGDSARGYGPNPVGAIPDSAQLHSECIVRQAVSCPPLRCARSSVLRRTTDEKCQVPGSLPYAISPARS